MAKKQRSVTTEMLRTAFIANLEAKRKPKAEAIVDFIEQELADFIRQYADVNFKGIYYETDHNYHDRICKLIPLNQEMKAANEAAVLRYSSHLKLYSTFLESKQFKQLSKRRIAGADETATKPAVPSSQKFREETEGGRKHIKKEIDVIYRNSQLRQQCLVKYGYQCQCCCMDLAETYGDELGVNFIEVHHLKLISTFEKDGIPENFLENLVPLCSTCHSMIHHIKDGHITWTYLF